MWVELCQYFGHCFLNEFIDIDRVNVLVVYDMEQVTQSAASAVDDVQAVA